MADIVASRPAPPITSPAPFPGERAPERRRPWLLLWAPFWFGSEVPVFTASARATYDRDLGPAGELVLRGLDQISRWLWFRYAIHVVTRAIWLTLAIGCGWLLLDLAGGPAFQWRALLWIGVPLVVLALVFAIINRPGRYQTARMLDRSFGLRDRLTTTLDHLGLGVPVAGEQRPLVYLQMADAANVIADLRQHRAIRLSIPVRELMMIVGFALLLVGLFFLRGTGEGIPALAAPSVPRFTPAVEQPPEAEAAVPLSPEHTELAPTVEEVLERSRRSTAAQRDLQQLAGALQDHATTRPAAEAINQGEFDNAANRLRDFAAEADQLSPAAREALARDLDQAASRMSPENGELRGATEQAAEGLREGGEPAQTSVEDLGDAVERTGEQVASQQELADQMQQAQESDRGRGRGTAPTQSESAQSQESEPGAGEQGSEGNQGEGAEQSAEGSEQSDQQGQAAGGQDEGSAASGESGRGQAAGEAGSSAGQSASGQGGAEGGSGEQPALAGEPQAGDSDEAGQGAGAAGGDSDNEALRAGGQRTGVSPGPGAGEAERRVTDASGQRVESEAPADTSAEVQLPAAPGGEGMQTVNNAGGMVRGSGAGITAGSGNAVQAEIDEAGPDSNHVPEAYRPVVERYFSNLDDE